METETSEEYYLTRFKESIARFCDPPQNSHLTLHPGLEINERHGDRFIQDILRRSDQVLRVDEAATTVQSDWDPSSWVFSFTPQIHTGGRRGMGGRPSGTTIDVRRHFKSLLCSVLSSTLLMLDERDEIRLRDFLHPQAIAKLRIIQSQGLSNLYKKHFSALPGNLLGVCAKFTLRDTPTAHEDGPEIVVANARDRHLLCSWVDRQGTVRCSCIGKTIFTAKSNGGQFSSPCCVHASHMYSFFESLLPLFSVNRPQDCRILLSSLSAALKEAVGSPKPFTNFEETAVFLTYKESADFARGGEQWVPIRVNTKRRRALICAFCDMRSENNCAHILEWKRCQELGFLHNPENENLVLPESGENPEMSSHLDDDIITRSNLEDPIFLLGQSIAPNLFELMLLLLHI